MVFIDIASNTFSSNLESIQLSSTRTLEPEIIFPSADDSPIAWECGGLEKIDKHSNIDNKDKKIGKIDINTIDRPLRKKLDQEYLGSD